MLGGIDVHHRAASGHGRHAVRHEFAAHHQQSGRPRAADELVRREEDRVLVRRLRDALGGVHLDVDVRRARSEVPEGQRAVLVQQRGDAVGVRHDAGHVGRRREAADLERPVGVLLQLLGKLNLIDVPVGVLVDRDDVGDRLAPRQLVGVMLERPDEHDRSLVRRDLRGEVVAIIEFGGDPQSHDPDQFVDSTGAARAGKDHDRLVIATNGVADEGSSVLAQPRGLEPSAACLGVGVGVARQHLISDELLDEGQAPPGRRVVGVRHPARAIRTRHHLVVADHGRADPFDERG